MKTKGDANSLYEKLSASNQNNNVQPSVNKPHIKPTKPSGMNKGRDEFEINQSRKKAISHYIGGNMNSQAQGSSSPSDTKESTINEGSANGAHKKPRQPKQRVGVSSKVSSSEKEPNKQPLKG